MARRFFKKTTRRASRFARRAYRAAGKAQPSLMTSAIYGAGYGAARPFIAGFVKPVSSMIPAGGYQDEVALGLLGFAAAKWGTGIVRNVGRTALIVESASVGQQLIGGISNNASAMSSPSQWAI